MSRARQFPPAKGISKEFLFNADTLGDTSSSGPDDRKQRGKKPKGERVEAPGFELQPPEKRDWGKIGVYLSGAIFSVGLIYNYADLSSLVKSTAEDVKDLKKKSDELLRSSIEVSARMGVLERRDSALPPSSIGSAAQKTGER
jgi:hypothetical protein